MRLLVGLEVGRHVGDRDDGEDVVGDVLRHPHAHRDEDLLGVGPDHLEDRQVRVRLLLLGDLGLGLLVDRGLLELEPDVETDQDEDGRQQERDPPAPGLEVGVALDRREHEQHTGRHQVAQRHAGLRPRGPEPAVLLVAVLGGHQHRAAPLAADRESLQEPADQQQDRGSHADRRVRRQQADREGGDTHQHQRDDEHLLAAHAVAEVTEHHPAQRSRDEAECVGAEGEQRRGDRLRLREEQRAEHQGGCRPVEEEVVPLDGGPDQAGEDDLDDPVLPGLGARVGCGD